MRLDSWSWDAAEAADGSLAQLRAISSPEPDQALVNRFYSAAEREIDLLRKIANAALFGHGKRVRTLAARRVVATQRKGAVVSRLSARWNLDLEALLDCPLMLSG